MSSTAANVLLEELPIQIAQGEDDSYTIYVYDVQLDEKSRETGRTRMDLTGATIVQHIKDAGGKILGVPTANHLFSTPTVTLTDATKAFAQTAIGKEITVSGSISPANDGTFAITAVPTPTTLEYTNAAGVAEVASGASYEISDIILKKNSGNPAQIEIHADQVTETTKGSAILKYNGIDTSGLIVGAVYWHDIWVHRASGVVRITKKSRFLVEDGVYEPSTGVPTATPGAPATQNQQMRSFSYTLPTLGDTFVIPIPGTGMVDGNYAVEAHIQDRNGGNGAVLTTPTAGRSATQLTLETSGDLSAGAIIDFMIRDA